MISLLQENPKMRDEVYFQLIKQTRDNPNPEWLKHTWELFLIIATFFPSSRDSEIWIKSHLFEMSRSPVDFIHTYSQFSYIRFCARCSIGKPFETSELNIIKNIPKHPFEHKQYFGSSIYEMLWAQSSEHPTIRFPYILHQMCEAIISKDGINTIGIFRTVGNMRIVKEIADEFRKGKISISETNVSDLASLLKKWVADLPDPMIPFELNCELENACEDNKFLEFVENTLPAAHHDTLMYLIGFCQRICANKNVNKMGPDNIAVCFAPNVVQLQGNPDEQTIKKFVNISRTLITFLIENWNTSAIYPLNE